MCLNITERGADGYCLVVVGRDQLSLQALYSNNDVATATILFYTMKEYNNGNMEKMSIKCLSQKEASIQVATHKNGA
jgi:hypothetical protein